MKKILLFLLISLNLYSSENASEKLIDFGAIEKTINEVNVREFLRSTADCLDSLSTKDLSTLRDNALNKLNEKLNYFNLQEAQAVTYEVRVLTTKNATVKGTAVALTSDGTLITRYHTIGSYKNITVINSKGQKYDATVGKISVANDLAYLHIKVKDIPFATLADSITLGEEIHFLSYQNLLLQGIASKINPESVILNIDTTRGSSGAGVFNNANELVSIVLKKDILDKTTFSIRHNAFDTIIEEFKPQNEIFNVYTNSYDNSYCYDEDELKKWNKDAKSKDLRALELHALFLGLCKKVGDEDLSTEQAEFILESSRHRLFGEKN